MIVCWLSMMDSIHARIHSKRKNKLLQAMTTKTFFIALLSIIILHSCDVAKCITKDQFITSYSTFVDQVEEMRRSQKTDLSSTDEDFKAYMNSCYEQFRDKLTLEEKKTIWKKTLKYYYNRFGTDFKAARQHAKENFSDRYNQDLEEVLKNADKDIANLFKDLFKDDIGKTIDGVLDFLNDVGDQLKKELDK